MMRKGVVTALYREPSTGEAPYVAASLITSPDSTLWQPIQAAPLNGWPPPRAMAWFEETGNGSWVCAGSIGHRDTILRDHFTISAAGTLYGDTPWTQTGTLGTLVGTYTAGGRGVVKLTSTAVAGQFLALQKADLLVVASDSLWFSARVRYVTDGTNDPTNLLTGTGLASSDIITFNIAAGAADVGVFARRAPADFAGNWSLQTVNQGAGAASLNTDTGVAFVFDTWYWLDIVHHASAGWASMWVNGVGPTTNTGASLPVPDAGYEPFAQIYPGAAASRRMNVDFIGLEHFTAAVQP